MLRHLNDAPAHPRRVVVLGAAGFVGRAVLARLARDGVPVLPLTKGEVDLLAADAVERLGDLLKPHDALVAAAARAPVKDADMLTENMLIARAMVLGMARASCQPLSHVVNISSDAIYADSAAPLTEASSAAPDSLHGAMHLARELMLRSAVAAPIAMLRPTLIYGSGDPHNGYGPNRFRRGAARGEDIELFGEGEERRDHVHIADVAELVVQVLYRRSAGSLNIATGKVHTFRDIAQRVISLSGSSSAIVSRPRSGPMPHQGYRAFDIAVCRTAFPDFRYTPLEEGLNRSQGAD